MVAGRSAKIDVATVDKQSARVEGVTIKRNITNTNHDDHLKFNSCHRTDHLYTHDPVYVYNKSFVK